MDLGPSNMNLLVNKDFYYLYDGEYIRKYKKSDYSLDKEKRLYDFRMAKSFWNGNYLYGGDKV